MGFFTASHLKKMKQSFRAKQLQKAISYANKIDPSEVRTAYDLSMMADIYMCSENFDAAKKVYSVMYNRNKSARTCKQLIKLCIKQGEVKEALQYVKELKRLDEEDYERYIFQYQIGQRLGQDEEYLLACLLKVREADYIDVWALELAKLYYKMGRTDECIGECRNIKLWFPDTEYALRADEILEACADGTEYEASMFAEGDYSDYNYDEESYIDDIKQSADAFAVEEEDGLETDIASEVADAIGEDDSFGNGTFEEEDTYGNEEAEAPAIDDDDDDDEISMEEFLARKAAREQLAAESLADDAASEEAIDDAIEDVTSEDDSFAEDFSENEDYQEAFEEESYEEEAYEEEPFFEEEFAEEEFEEPAFEEPTFEEPAIEEPTFEEPEEFSFVQESDAVDTYDPEDDELSEEEMMELISRKKAQSEAFDEEENEKIPYEEEFVADNYNDDSFDEAVDTFEEGADSFDDYEIDPMFSQDALPEDFAEDYFEDTNDVDYFDDDSQATIADEADEDDGSDILAAFNKNLALNDKPRRTIDDEINESRNRVELTTHTLINDSLTSDVLAALLEQEKIGNLGDDDAVDESIIKMLDEEQ